jgi:LacI family transcriptional regulator
MNSPDIPPMKNVRTGPTSAPRVSLKQIAAAAGVSRMTVSLALRNTPTVAVATRERIQAIAAKLDYHPDPEIGRVMASIRSGRHIHKSATIAYLTAHETENAWRDHPTQLVYYQGVQAKAEALGYQLQIIWLRTPGMTSRRLSEVIRNRGIDGVIVAPFPKGEQFFSGFRWDYFSAVALGYSMVTPMLCRACNHQFQSIQLLVEELRTRGYRRIGYAMEADQDNRVRHNWRGGFLSNPAVFSDLGDVPFLLDVDWNRDRFARWLQAEKPDAVITAGPEVQRWLRELGLRTPADIGLAHVDLVTGIKSVTGIDQNSRQVGSAAVELLTSLMNSHQRGVPAVPQVLMVQGTFVQGLTTKVRHVTKGRKKPVA